MRSRAVALTALMLVTATPLAAAPLAKSAPTALVQRYLGALQAKRYADAFALLEPGERAYFRNVANFASGFTADGFVLDRFAVTALRHLERAQLVLARERIALDDPAHGVRVSTSVTVPYLVVGSVAQTRIADAGRPWRAFAANASGTAGGLQVTVKKVALYARSIRVIVTMQNVGERFVTVLPYGRSVLRDDAGAIYHPLETNDWQLTDRQFFLGVRLAPNTRYTGALAFLTPRLDDRTRRYALTLGPGIRDGGNAPFSVDVAGVVPRG